MKNCGNLGLRCFVLVPPAFHFQVLCLSHLYFILFSLEDGTYFHYVIVFRIMEELINGSSTNLG